MKPAHAFKASLKAALIALSIAAISPAHATGVPTVDGSAIISNLQQWYQSAQRWYSQMQSMQPGEIAGNLIGADKAKTQAQSYIDALKNIQKQMKGMDMCSQYKVTASKDICTQEYNFKLARIQAYIDMMEDVKEDYDSLMTAVNDYNGSAKSASTGDVMTGGGNTKTGELSAKAEAVKAAQKKLSDHMQQHAQYIQSIDSNIKMVHEVRLDVARLQFEGNSGGLSSLLSKAAVSGTLITAAAKYESDAEDLHDSTEIKMGKRTKIGTDY